MGVLREMKAKGVTLTEKHCPKNGTRPGYVCKLLLRGLAAGCPWCSVANEPSRSMVHHQMACGGTDMVNGWHHQARKLPLRGNLHVHHVCGTPVHHLATDLEVQRGWSVGARHRSPIVLCKALYVKRESPAAMGWLWRRQVWAAGSR